MYKKFVVSAFIITILVASCAKKSVPLSDDELQISLTRVCGWCAPGDSFTLGNLNTTYIYYPSSCERKGTPVIKKTDKAEWDELVSLLDMEQFNSIDLNICNVCADGCDARVTVKQGRTSHSISYGSISNETVAPIKPFLEKLEAISNRYRTEAGK